jgi:DNA ligase-1
MRMIPDGEIVLVQGSGKKPYELKNIGGVYSCSCPAWRNQSFAIDKRSCKHLKQANGQEFEILRTQNGETATKNLQVAIHESIKGRKLRPDEKTKLNGPPILLAQTWTPDIDPTGYWMSEKLDGVRAYWNGENFISRQGNTYHAPEWFKEGLPKDKILDGELWMGRQMFQKTISVVKRQDAGDEWKAISYQIYDMPDSTTPFEYRMDRLEIALRDHPPYATLLRQARCDGQNHLAEYLSATIAKGGEGIMLRKPGSLYEPKRSHTLLKVKNFSDAEAIVIGYEPGKGRHKGRMGALHVQMPDGKTFLIGTGFSDRERETPPMMGAKITYRYTELTTGGIPKCASFVTTRNYE